MADILENAPVRLPDHASVEAALARFPAGADEAALTAAFPGFVFSAANDDDEYWRVERSVLAADGTRIAEYRPWMEAELAKNNGDVEAVWSRLRETDLQISEWHGNSVYAFAPTGSGAADYVQTSLGREIEWRAGPIVNPSYRPWSELDLLDSSWIDHDARSDDKVIAGLLYRLSKRAGSSVVHVRTFLTRYARLERDKREARAALRWNSASGSALTGRRGPFSNCSPTGSMSCRARCASFRTGRNRARTARASSNIGRSTSPIMSTTASERSGSSPVRCICRRRA